MNSLLPSLLRRRAAAPMPPADRILADLPRGEEGRRKGESALPRVFFESEETLARIGFREFGADIYLGIVGGRTEALKRADGRWEYTTKGGVPVGIRDDRHMMTVAGSRSGKGRCAIIPNLLTYGGSVLTIDPKGENASITAKFRADVMGHNVCVLDPFQITNSHCAALRRRFNPLSFLRLDSMTLIEDAGLVADALVVPAGGNDAHWDESAKAFIEGVILHVVTWAKIKRADKTLITVADLIAGHSLSFNELLAQMMENDALENRIVAAARSMAEKSDRELASVVSVTRKNLRFLQYDSMRGVLAGNDFDLDSLREGKTTIYLVLPAVRMSTCAQWLRLFVNLSLASAEMAKKKPVMPTLLLLDEFPVLGRMQELEKAIGQIAGLGIRIWTILQDMGQLQALYEDRWETFLGNSGVIQCFGNVDHCSSQWVSQYLDKTTISVTDQSATTADQKNFHGASGQNTKQQVQDLMTPAEVRRYFARDDHLNRQLVLIPGRRPYILQRANYDQHEMFAGRFKSWKS